MQEVKYETPQVIQQFATWYNQLPQNEQVTLYNYLHQWISKNSNQNLANKNQIRPLFEGKTYGTATNKVVSNQPKNVCVNCGTSFDAVVCSGCGSIVKIE